MGPCHCMSTSLLVCHKLAYLILFLSRKLNQSTHPNCKQEKRFFAELLFQVMPFGKVLIYVHPVAPGVTEAVQGLGFRVGASEAGPWVSVQQSSAALKVYSTVSSWHKGVFSQMKLFAL